MKKFEDLSIEQRNYVGPLIAQAIYHRCVQLGVEARVVVVIAGGDGQSTCLKNMTDDAMLDLLKQAVESHRAGTFTRSPNFDVAGGRGSE
ncbi:MAG TPA: hypothetical protein VGE52_12345 [Pirellulales bacterium]